MREAELRARLAHHLGAVPALIWAEAHVVGELGSRTVDDALAAGVPCKEIWRAVWRHLELPASER